MTFDSTRTMLSITAILIVSFMGARWASGQSGQEPKPPMSEQVFKNVIVLKGIAVDELINTMGMFSAALSLNCTDCHVPESTSSLEKFADDTPLKRTARRMILMMNSLNKTNFGGRSIVTCYTCHRGEVGAPKFVPNLAVQYGAPPEDPNEVNILSQSPNAPAPDEVFARYLQALGGAQRVANLTSFAGKGTYDGWETDHQKVDVEVYAKAPAQRTVV